ncbi:MAG: RAD55 family ATPase [Nitrososphaerales archaeon]
MVEDIVRTSEDAPSSYLLDFFTVGGRSVLIRGDPGTGKTSLVLQLLDYHSKNGFKSIYMSTRLSAETLKSHQPWVEVAQGKYGTVPRLAENQIGFQDSRRMDGVRALAGMRQYLEQVKNPFVVLDSWEGLFFETHTLGVEAISKLVEDYDARFVVVTERREQTDLDYLLDGVVVLRRKFHEGRIVREIELKKLRGVSINQSRFLFTLESGRFRYLPPFGATTEEEDSEVGEPLTSMKKDYFSSGALSMDLVLEGGLKRGSLNLLELKTDVPTRVSHLVLRTIFSNFVNSGSAVVFAPFIGTAKREMAEILPNLSRETLERRVVVLGYGPDEKGKEFLTGELSSDFNLINSTIEKCQEETGKSVLVVFDEDALEELYGADDVSKYLARSISRIRSGDNIHIQITSPHAALVTALRALCNVDLRVELINGTPVLYTDKPISTLHGMIRDPAAKGKLGLLPIV